MELRAALGFYSVTLIGIFKKQIQYQIVLSKHCEDRRPNGIVQYCHMLCCQNYHSVDHFKICVEKIPGNPFFLSNNGLRFFCLSFPDFILLYGICAVL